MNKFYNLMSIAFFAVLGICFISCSDDDKDDNGGGVDKTPISLFAGREKAIEGAKTIDSSDKFVAYSKDNIVYGYHVGSATLSVNGKYKIPVSVLPMYNLYDDPVCEWGCNIANVKSKQKQGTLSSKSTSEMLTYENAGGATLLGYSFKDGKLSAAMAIVSTNHTSTLASFLAERYMMIPVYEGEETYFAGIDAIDTDHAKTIAIMNLYNTDYWWVYYTDYKASTRSVTNYDEMKELKESLIPLLAK